MVTITKSRLLHNANPANKLSHHLSSDPRPLLWTLLGRRSQISLSFHPTTMYSSGPTRPVKKNQGSPSAHKCRNKFGPHDNHNASVTELTGDKSPFLSILRFLSLCELALHLRGHLHPISLPCPLRYTLRWIFQVCASPSLTWAVNGECVGATTANRTSMPLLSINTSV